MVAYIMGINRSLVKSFSFAIEGIKTALKEEPNFKIHAAISVIVIILAYFLGFSRLEWLILLFTVFFILILELINTAVEELVNIVSPEVKREAKNAKDVIAASVLLGAIFAVLVGVFLFLPKIAALI